MQDMLQLDFEPPAAHHSAGAHTCLCSPEFAIQYPVMRALAWQQISTASLLSQHQQELAVSVRLACHMAIVIIVLPQHALCVSAVKQQQHLQTDTVEIRAYDSSSALKHHILEGSASHHMQPVQ